MSPGPSDFRSDTVTLPTPAMMAAMVEAEVGDDVLGDDPTVNALEARLAQMFGKEAGLFVPSGTMANQAAVAAHVFPGEEVIVETNSHIFRYEGGGLARVAGAHVRTLVGDGGQLPLDELNRAVRHPSVQEPRTALLCLEQTHLFSGGAILPLPYLEQVFDFSREKDVLVHVDGARLFNAVAETGVELPVYGNLCDSLMISLSKGLSCPVGSVLMGDGAFIERARRARKWLGGGMRQVGYLAACGLVALDETVPEIGEDNARCRRLGSVTLGLEGIRLAQETVDTNILFLEVTAREWDAPMMVSALEDKGVLALAMGDRLLRFVTHRHIQDGDVDRAVAALQSILEG
ncbi:MAG TPA: threonine aldolase [Planctomycetes bacterium]|nr:threonine aldolase [Planctomycetota bacterium]